MNPWQFRPFADKLQNSYKKRPKQVVTDLLVCQFWSLVTTKTDLTWPKSTLQAPSTTGKPQPSAKTPRTQRYSYKSDTKPTCKSKTPSTLPWWPWKKVSKVKWTTPTSKSASSDKTKDSKSWPQHKSKSIWTSYNDCSDLFKIVFFKLFVLNFQWDSKLVFYQSFRFDWVYCIFCDKDKFKQNQRSICNWIASKHLNCYSCTCHLLILFVLFQLFTQDIIPGPDLHQILKTLSIPFQSLFNILLNSTLSSPTHQMLPEKLVFGLDVLQGILVLILQGLVFFKRRVQLIVLLMKLQTVLHDELLTLGVGLEIHDLHLVFELLKLLAGGYQVIAQLLDYLLVVLDNLFQLLDTFHLDSQSLLEGSIVSGLFGFWRTACGGYLFCCLEQSLNLLEFFNFCKRLLFLQLELQ